MGDGVALNPMGDLDGGVFTTSQPDPDVDCGAFTDTTLYNAFSTYDGGDF